MIELIPNEWRYRDSETKMPYPWYVRPVIQMLDAMNLKDKKVFEYGVGDSTLWYRSRGAIVSGVDHDSQWADKLDAVFCADSIDYPYCLSGHKEYDIIVIDGIARDECLPIAINYLMEDGFIIIDNFEQIDVEPHWPLTRACIKDNNLKLEIFKEPNHPTWQTAIVRL